VKLTKFETLWEAVNHYELDKIARTETKIFEEAGLNSDLSDIFHLDDGLITLLKDGTVRKTIVYISEIKRWTLNTYGNYPKFHIFNCRTLVQMKNGGKIERYKKTSRADGKFLIVISGERDSDAKYVRLEICGNCLYQYNMRFNTRYTKATFDIKSFIDRSISINYHLNGLFFQDDLETVPQFYATNWRQISNELKKKRNYTCQKCGVQLKKAKQYLHTHHIDSNPSNNIIGNLKVLCIECHSNEFNHGHIKQNINYQQFLKYREELDR
jgi:5-methylcytosine-specific restriction endonuclease McrA